MKLKKIIEFLGKAKWYIRRFFRNTGEVWTRLREQPKPKGISFWEFFLIQRQRHLYQKLVFPDGVTIWRPNQEGLVESPLKWESLKTPENFSGQTVMDIGCAEGYFVIRSICAGAKHGTGIDLQKKRLTIARLIARAWGFDEKTDFFQMRLHEVPATWQVDYTFCLSVLHHLHKGSHDIWKIITEPEKYPVEFHNMLDAVKRVSDLTRIRTFFEYAYEYEDRKPASVDYVNLARLWETKGLYSRVEFVGLSAESDTKDRAIYHAYK